MQQHIKEIQALYREYLAKQANHDELMANLERSNEIMDEIARFYFGGMWRRYYDDIENGATVDLTTEGEYSVMSQDTLWDALCSERVFYENLLNYAQKRLHEMDRLHSEVIDEQK